MINAEEALHQGGFAGAVFAHEGMYRTGTQEELSIIQRFDAWEFFYDPGHLQYIFMIQNARHHFSYLSLHLIMSWQTGENPLSANLSNEFKETRGERDYMP